MLLKITAVLIAINIKILFHHSPEQTGALPSGLSEVTMDHDLVLVLHEYVVSSP